MGGKGNKSRPNKGKRQAAAEAEADQQDLDWISLGKRRAGFNDDVDEESEALPTISQDGSVKRQKRVTVADNVFEDEPNQEPERKQRQIEDTDETRYLKELAASEEQFEAKRKLIATSCSKLVENPEGQIKLLPPLVALCVDPDAQIAKLALVSSALVFKDISPGYRLREVGSKENLDGLSKAVKSVRVFENTLLREYKLFLKHAESTARGQAKNMVGSNIRRKALQLAAVKSLCQLVEPLRDFNMATTLAQSIAGKLTHPNKDISSACYKAIANLLHRGMGLPTIQAVVKRIAGIAREAKGEVDTSIVKLLLRIPPNSLVVEEETEGDGDEELPKSEEQRKLDADFDEAESMSDMQKKLAIQASTAILDDMFSVFFRVMRAQSRAEGPLMAALEGVGRYSHLINIDFIADVVANLRTICTDMSVEASTRLQCISAAFELIRSQGNVWSIDLKEFNAGLFEAMLRAVFDGSTFGEDGDLIGSHETQSSDVKLKEVKRDGCEHLLLRCLHGAVMETRQFSQSRVDAFSRRASSLALHARVNMAGALQAWAKGVYLKYPKSLHLFENDGVGSGSYDMCASDPDHCGAQSSIAWEYVLLNLHYHPMLRRLAVNCTNAESASNVVPEIVYSKFDTDSGRLNPPVAAPKGHPLAAMLRKRQRKASKSVVYVSKPSSESSWLKGLEKREASGNLVKGIASLSEHSLSFFAKASRARQKRLERYQVRIAKVFKLRKLIDKKKRAAVSDGRTQKKKKSKAPKDTAGPAKAKIKRSSKTAALSSLGNSSSNNKKSKSTKSSQ